MDVSGGYAGPFQSGDRSLVRQAARDCRPLRPREPAQPATTNAPEFNRGPAVAIFTDKIKKSQNEEIFQQKTFSLSAPSEFICLLRFMPLELRPLK